MTDPAEHTTSSAEYDTCGRAWVDLVRRPDLDPVRSPAAIGEALDATDAWLREVAGVTQTPTLRELMTEYEQPFVDRVADRQATLGRPLGEALGHAHSWSTFDECRGGGGKVNEDQQHPWYVVVLALVIGVCGIVTVVSLTAILAWLAWHTVT